MRLSNHELYKAIRASLALGMVGLVGATGTAFAQEDQDDARTLDRVEVTGTRIKRVDVETASPVLQIERADLEASGLQTIGEVVRSISAADNTGLTNITSSTNANDGSQTVSLRNLGANRTLVLINGRRWVDAGGGVVDLTTIPVAMVERIEVLKDGASAIYGSDAIAGVINIITRSDYEGATASAYWGENSEGDGRLQAYDFTLGGSWERGNVVMGAAYTKQDEISAGDREISAEPIYACASPIGGALCGSGFGQRGTFGVPGLGNLTLRPEREIPGITPGQRTPADFRPFTNADRYNFAPVNYLLTPSERTTFYTQGTFNITENVNFNSTLYYNKRDSNTEIAEVPLTLGANNPGPQWQFPIAATSVYNPFGVDIRNVGFRTSAVGPRTSIQSYDNWGFVGGFDGYFELGSRFFSWEATYQHYESAQSTTGENFINLFNLARGLGPSFLDASGNAICGTPTARIAGCVPVNLFNGQAGLTEAMINYISYNTAQEFSTGMDNYLLNVSGDLFELPGGMMSFAAGYEYRINDLTDIPDSLIASGGSSTNFREPTRGEVESDEYYLEFVIPLLSDVTLADRLEFNVAARYSDYQGAGFVGPNLVRPNLGDTTNLKAGFTWKPFEDLLFRGNWAETFRVPTIGNLYAGGGEGFPQAADPCSNNPGTGYNSLSPAGQAQCRAGNVPVGGVPQLNAQIRTLFGGNPNLRPEFGDTKTLGFVYSPSWLEGFNIALDWWNIELNDGISAVNAQTTLDRCYREQNAFACANLIGRDGVGNINVLRAGSENLAEFELEGFDFGFSYRFDTDFGRFGFVFDSSYTSEFRTGAQGAIIPPRNQVGQLVGTTSTRFRKRGNLGLNWALGDWGVNYNLRHTSSLVEPCNNFVSGFAAGVFDRQVCSDPTRVANNPVTGLPQLQARNKIGATTYHDIQVSWKSPIDSTIRFGVRNLTDKDPPYALNSFANSFLQTYDVPGRFWYASYTQNF